MISYPLSKLAEIMSAQLLGEDKTIDYIWVDTRQIVRSHHGMFIALSGSQKSGEIYVENAYDKGIRAFLVSQTPELLPGASYLVVKDTLKALQQLATYHRNQFNLPIIGITGSNGKTIVKEWLHQLLYRDFRIVRSPKSYNSQIGVALSLMEIIPDDQLGIFEAGISQPNEMQNLAEMMRPQIGVLTNIGSAHTEYFKDRNQHIHEKLKLFYTCKKVVIPFDDEQLRRVLQSTEELQNTNFITWGKSVDADIWVKEIIKIDAHTEIQFQINQQFFHIQIPFMDDAAVANAITCVATIHSLELKPQEFIQTLEQFKKLHTVEMRLEIKEGMYDSLIINDSFNSDLTSIPIALNTLNQQQKEQKTLILTDILQSLEKADELYQEVANWVNAYPIHRVILVGDEVTKYKDLFTNFYKSFPNTQSFLQNMKQTEFNQQAVLLKGARVFQLEKISQWLEKKSHDTVLEVDLHSLHENINYFRSKLKPETKLMCMVKAFGYGTGGIELATALESIGVDYLGVAYADEGAVLRRAGITAPIMVMNPEQSSYNQIIDNHLEPEIYSLRVLDKFVQKLNEKSYTQTYPIHIKLNTGMNRLGFDEKDIPTLKLKLKENPQLKVVSVFSHNATADMPEEKDFVLNQVSTFQKMFQELTNETNPKPMAHILNSEGVLNFPEFQMNMVRLGIGMYGISVSKKHQQFLHNVVTFKTVISQIREIESGETVSYGRRFRAEKTTKIATLPVGYADGIARVLGNGNTKVNVKGKLCPVIGTVCMDMMMVDVTDVDCEEGDEVIIFGDSPSIEEIAKAAQTIPYEVLTSISSRVKRIYIRE